MRAGLATAIVISGSIVCEARLKPRHGAVRIVKAQSPRECLARAMYFESNRTAEDGMLAVGTVVANRFASGRYGPTICSVVGQKSQFAPGVLTRAMVEKGPAELARQMADEVLAGRRHPVAADAMYFHTANVPFRNDDKRYLLVSGGNAFYAWNRSGAANDNLASLARAQAAAETARAEARNLLASLKGASPETKVASAEPAPQPEAAPIPRRLRVIVPTEPVQAAMGPVWAAPSATPPALVAEPEPTPAADFAVAQAWAPFDGYYLR